MKFPLTASNNLCFRFIKLFAMTKFLVILLILSFHIKSFAQFEQRTKNDSIKNPYKAIQIDPDLYKEPFIDCKLIDVFLYSDSVTKKSVYLKRNFTDQFLQVCSTSQLLPASRIYGFACDNKFYRSGNTYGNNYVFAEKILEGNTSLYYCRNIPILNGLVEYISTDSKNPGYTNNMIIEDETPKRFKNDFSYFITPRSDTTKMIYVCNSNIGEIANTYFADCPLAYNDAMRFTQRYKKIQNITLPIGLICLGYGSLNLGKYPRPSEYIPAFSIAFVALTTYTIFRIIGGNRYLHPYDMIRITTNYNNCR
jgi:hypothetical protein